MFRCLPPLLLAVLLTCAGSFDTAHARARSSGGYSRPSSFISSGSYRRPSPSLSYAPRAPSGGSGGYAVPARRPSTVYRSAPTSGGDAALSRQFSARSLQDYRASQAPPPAAYGTGGDRRPSTYGNTGLAGGGYAQPRSWAPVGAPPAYGWAQQGRRFGVWDGLMLWGLLNSLSAPGHAAFFHNNEDSPAYRQWRAEAQQAAATDPAVQAKLTELDQRLAQMQNQPRQPGAVPPLAARPGRGGNMAVIIVLLLAAAAFGALWYRRRRAAAAAPAGAVPAALNGSARTRFRVGMTFPADPAPFVLAAGATKIKPPGDGAMISVEAVGGLMDGAVSLSRLYLPGRDAFFQLHLGADGKPDECRYFSRIDQVTPASQQEWGAWLDRAQGMIGWPQFQTKDGKLYDRAWAPGAERIEPRTLQETIQDLNGTSSRNLAAMLYMGPTGVASPAPEHEYILVSAVDAGGQAWVDIHAGIDVNPAALTLPSVALS